MSSGQLDVLEKLLNQSGSPPVADLKLALSRVFAEVSERTTKGSSASYEFLSHAVQTIGKIKGTAHADVRLNCLFESGIYFYRTGFASAALNAAHLVDKLARRINSKPWLRKAGTLSGIVHTEAGNIAEGVMRYCEALRLARETDDKSAEVAVLINLAAAFNYGSLHSEAIFCLNRAIMLSERHPELEHHIPIAYCDMAQAFLATEEYEKGFEAITKSLEHSREPQNGAGYFGRTIREFTYVRLALEVGKLARARQHATACRHYSQWGNNSRCRTLAEIAVGLCEISGGDVERGLGQLQKALETSGDFVASRIDALSALVKAYDEVERPEQALKCMTELLRLVRTFREQSIGLVVNLAPISSNLITRGHAGDVRGLELREARLRVKVAERELVNSQLEMLERLAVTADLKEEPSGQHGYRVGRLAGLLAKKAGFGADAWRNVELAARLHDIGKVAVPDRILFTSVELREAEKKQMRTHAVIGAEMLGKSYFDKLQLAEQVARHHHEWWDGTGYPSRLSGKRIPIHARIVAIADVFDALTHGRPYASAWPIERALEEIRNRRGTQFDPELTDLFLSLIDDLQREHLDLDAYLAEASRNSPFLQAREKIRVMLEGGRQAENMAAAATETVH
jgi:putative two-component system response regulator